MKGQVSISTGPRGLIECIEGSTSRMKESLLMSKEAYAFNNSQKSIEYASLIESRIILIDGAQLSKLMVEHNVGVSTVGQYEVKKIDTDYFDNN